MIPYEDLVTALTNWRINNGIQTGDADYLGEPRPLDFSLQLAQESQGIETAENDALSDSFDESMDVSVDEAAVESEYADPGAEEHADAYAAEQADEAAGDDAENDSAANDYADQTVAAAAEPAQGAAHDEIATEADEVNEINIDDEPTAYGDAPPQPEMGAAGEDPEASARAALVDNATQELDIDDAEASFGDLDEPTTLGPMNPEDDPEA